MTEELAIVLRVEEGINFNINNDPVLLVASVGGNVMESDPVTPGYTTLFDCNLVWQCDKNSVKRMKMESYPIKIEAYCLKDGDKELIGHLIYPLRNVARMPPAKAMTTKSKWFKLIGLSQQWRSQRPELLLNVIITDKDFFLKTKGIVELHEDSIDLNPQLDILTSQNGLFIRLLKEEGLLQIGNIDTNCDVFMTKIFLKNVRYPENLVDGKIDKDKFTLRYTFPPNKEPFVCEMFAKKEGYSLQEIIAINMRTSLKSLQMYFDIVFALPVQIWHEETMIGTAKLTLNDLLTVTNLNEFLACCQDNNEKTYEIESTCLINSIKELPLTVEKPLLEFRFALTFLSTKQLAVVEVSERKKMAEIDHAAGGDHAPIFELPPTETSAEIPQIEDDEIQSVKSVEAVSEVPINLIKSAPQIMSIAPENVEKIDKSERFVEEITELPCLETFHTFTYVLVLKSIKFSNHLIEDGVWQVSFYHPRADSQFTILNLELQNARNESLDFGNLELKLYFSTTTENVRDLVASDTAIFNISGPHGTRGKAELNNKSLLAASTDKAGIILLENQSGENIAMATICVRLDDLGVNHNSQLKKSISLEPAVTVKPYVDDGLAYRFVEDLEKWKTAQQEDFLVELKRKEIQHLAKLSAEWKRRKAKTEKDLADRLQKCQLLTNALEEAQLALKEKGIERLEHEQMMYNVKVELEECFNRKLLTSQEHNRQLESDMTRRLQDAALHNKKLELTNINLANENQSLKEKIASLEKTVHELRKNVFPKEQLVVLLQDMKLLDERYQNCRKSKMFYKEQWAKMIREVHIMRSEAVQREKEEIIEKKILGIDEWLETEKFELESEMSELEYIRKSFDCD